MDALEAIKTRRSIRSFRPHRIPQDILTQILEAAGDAPSAGNFQPWRVIAVTDKDKKEIIAKAAFEQYWISAAPVILVICSSLGNMEKDYGKRADKYATQSIAAFIQTLMLAAQSLGVSSCWVGDFVEPKIRKAFSIPDDKKIDAVVPLGYAAEKPKPKHRLEAHDYTYINKWDERGKHATIPLRETLTALHERLKELKTKFKSKAKK